MAAGIIAGTSAILLSWICLFVVTAGVGLVVRRWMAGQSLVNAEALLASFWLGQCLVVLAIQLLNFARPVTWHLMAGLVTAGLFGISRHWKPLGRWIRSLGHTRSASWTIVALAIALVWAANRATGACTAFDSGVYHLQAMQWAESFPVIPGLGNLHSRLALNNSSLLYSALLDHGFWAGRVTHISNGVYVFAMICQIALRLFQFSNGVTRRSARAIFDITLLAPTVALCLDSDYISSLTTDVPAGLTLFAAASMLLGIVTTDASDENCASRNADLATLLPVLALAVSFKLSSIVFAAFAGVIALCVLARRDQWAAPRWTHCFALAVVLSGLLLGSWLVRGVLLSGYPAYPSTVFSPGVAWRVPVEQAQAENAWIRHFARTYYSAAAYNVRPYVYTASLAGGWLRPWLRSLLTTAPARWQVTIPVAVVVIAVVATLGLRRPRPPAPSAHGWLRWALLCPPLVGIAAWFVVAPRPVFGFALFWILAALVVALRLESRLEAGGRARGFVAIAALITVLPVLLQAADAAIRRGRNPVAVLGRALLVRPTPDAWSHPTTAPDLEVFVTASGLALYVPRKANTCWTAPLPCTPHPSANLRLIDANRLGSGFISSGPWNHARYPNPDTRFLDSWREYDARARRNEH